MSWYRNRVERDLARWQTAGWVSEAGASSIRADLASRKSAVRRGADLRHARRRAVRLRRHELRRRPLGRRCRSWPAWRCCWSTLWGCYGAAAVLFQRRLEAFAQAAVLGGIAVFGASIMLIAQMYHMEGNPPDAVLMWALGALLAAALRAVAPGAGGHVRAAGGVELLRARARQRRALELPAGVGGRRRRGRLARLAPGPAPRRDQPRRSGSCRSATSCSTGTRTGSSSPSACSRPSAPPPRGRPSTGASRPPPRSSPTA